MLQIKIQWNPINRTIIGPRKCGRNNGVELCNAISLCKLYFEKYNKIQTKNELLFTVIWI